MGRGRLDRLSWAAVVLFTIACGLDGTSAAAVLGPEEELITGTITLTAPRIIQAKRLRFAPLATIVTNGFTLTLQANEIVVADSASIVSFSGATTASPGDSGRSAGPVILVATSVIGGRLTIDNHGEQGGIGLDGTAGASGPAGFRGSARVWNLGGCAGGTSGSPGGQGGAGGDGGLGGPGGNGGLILISIQSTPGGIQNWTVSAARGTGGKGGAGGPGGAGGVGGEGADGNALCGGTSPGPAGPPGPAGRRGVEGQEGLEGTVLNLGGAIAPCGSV